MTIGFVSALSKVSEDKLVDEDADIIGTYRFETEESLTDEQLANALLDSFHSTVPVKFPEDIELRTYNESEKEIVETGEIAKVVMDLKEFSPLHTFDD